MAWFWQWKQKYLDMRDKRDIALDERNEAREQRNAADVQVSLRTKERDGARAELEATRTQKAQVQSAFQTLEREHKAMEKSRDWFKAEWEKGKQEIDALQKAKRKAEDQRDSEMRIANEVKRDRNKMVDDLAHARAENKAKDARHRDAARKYDEIKSECDNLKEVIAEKDDEIEELADQHARAEKIIEDRKAVDAQRPTIEVELYDSKQGRKATPCKRFVGRYEGDVVAVSPPQGTPDETHARERIALLSTARWVIVQRKRGGDGKA